MRRADEGRNPGRRRSPAHSSCSTRALAAEAEQVLRDAAHLHFLRSLGDAVATMMAIDVFERQCAAISHAAVHLHSAIRRLAAQPVGAEITNRYHVADGQRILTIHLPGCAEDEVAH